MRKLMNKIDRFCYAHPRFGIPNLMLIIVIGNAAVIPDGLFTPASTLTSVLTMGMGNEVMGTVQSDALWSLAMLLMIMSLVFIAVIHAISRKGSVKR